MGKACAPTRARFNDCPEPRTREIAQKSEQKVQATGLGKVLGCDRHARIIEIMRERSTEGLSDKKA